MSHVNIVFPAPAEFLIVSSGSREVELLEYVRIPEHHMLAQVDFHHSINSAFWKIHMPVPSSLIQ